MIVVPSVLDPLLGLIQKLDKDQKKGSFFPRYYLSINTQLTPSEDDMTAVQCCP